MVDDTDNEIEHIKNNPHNLAWTSAIRVNQEDEDSETSIIDLLDSSDDENSGDELDDIEEEEEGEWMAELSGMQEDQDDSDPGIKPITNNALPCQSSGQTAEQENNDFDIQNAEEVDHVDAEFENIALTELGGANDSDAQAQMQEQTDNVDVDWWVTLLVRVVAVRAAELLSELSRCQRCFQSCCESCCQSSAAVRAAAVRATVQAAVRPVVRAQPLSEPLSKLLSELCPLSA